MSTILNLVGNLIGSLITIALYFFPALAGRAAIASFEEGIAAVDASPQP